MLAGRWPLQSEGFCQEQEKQGKGTPAVALFVGVGIFHCFLQIQPLLDLVPDAKYPLRLMEADLLNPESWKEPVKSCSYVFHIASPCPSARQPLSEELLIPPAVEGTLSILRACVEAGTVKRVIITSSFGAVCCTNLGIPGKPDDYIYSESDWTDEATAMPYEKSKLKAEQAAWEFVQNLDEDKRFELVVINPGYVQGPLLSAANADVSKLGCMSILSGEVPLIPTIHMPYVDIRDLVTAQMAALEKPEAAGNRYLVFTSVMTMREMAVIMAEEFRLQGYKVSTTWLPKPVIWLASFFDSTAKFLYRYVGKPIHVSNDKMVCELGITPTFALKDSIIDMCYGLIELGLVKKTPGYLGHPSSRPQTAQN